MKSIKFTLVFIFLSLLSSPSLTAQVTVLTNLGETNGFASAIGDPTGLENNLFLAQEFVTGTTAYTSEPITVTVNIASTGGAPTFQVDIYDKSGVVPNVSILTLTGSNSPGVGNNLYTGNATLAASTSYYIVVSAPTSFPAYQISTVITGTITAIGFTAPNQTQGSDGGFMWNTTQANQRLEFAITLPNALPVELVDFRANYEDKITTIEWETASERNNDYFEIQHSMDGDKFETIGIERGNGTTTFENSYYFEHLNPSSGVHYYRLKQVDFDSQYEYSKIISVNVNVESPLKLNPIPAQHQLTIKNGKGLANVFNMLGQSVQQFRIDENQQTIQISNLPNGHYWLQILQANGKVIGEKFIKNGNQ